MGLGSGWVDHSPVHTHVAGPGWIPGDLHPSEPETKGECLPFQTRVGSPIDRRGASLLQGDGQGRVGRQGRGADVEAKRMPTREGEEGTFERSLSLVEGEEAKDVEEEPAWEGEWRRRRRRVRRASVFRSTGKKDYYQTLGVDCEAEEDEIRRAYLKMALKWHPDKHKGKPAVKKYFQEIGEAYHVLSDAALRWQYDQAAEFDVDDLSAEEYIRRFKQFIFTTSGLGMDDSSLF